MNVKFGRLVPIGFALAGLVLVAAPREAHAILRVTSFRDNNFNGVFDDGVDERILDVLDNNSSDPNHNALGTDNTTGLDPSSEQTGLIKLGGPTNVGGLNLAESRHVSNANSSIPFPDELDLDDYGAFSRLSSTSLAVSNPRTVNGSPNTTTVSHVVVIEDSALTAGTEVNGANGNATGFGPNVNQLYNILTSVSGTFSRSGNDDIASGSFIRLEWFANAGNSQRSLDDSGSVADPLGILLRSVQFNYDGAQATQGFGGTGFEEMISFDAGPDTQFGMALRFTITLTPGAGITSRSQTMTAEAVPEPATALSALLGLGLFAGGAYLRRRRAAG